MCCSAISGRTTAAMSLKVTTPALVGKDANKRWYGVMRFFDWLESKAYKMHIRVLLSKYRAYTPCNADEGARLKPTSINFRLGSKANADAVAAWQTLFTRHFKFGAARWKCCPASPFTI